LILPRDLELLAEAERRLAGVGRVVVLEQGLSVRKLADQVGRGVEAQRELAVLGRELRQHERIAPGIGADVDRFGDHAVFAHEHVDAFVEAHQCERHRLVARREDDREMPLRLAELVDGERNDVLARQPDRLVRRAAVLCSVLLRAEGHELFVEQRQVGSRCGSHGFLSN
jgi:hypothetical protein